MKIIHFPKISEMALYWQTASPIHHTNFHTRCASWIPSSPGTEIIRGIRAVFQIKRELKSFPTRRKNSAREFSNKPQDEEEACLKMAVVDMAAEEAATQLFT